MNKEDKFIVTDATDIICIGGFGYDLEQGELLSQEDIKSIVTKEQFSSMKYEVVE